MAAPVIQASFAAGEVSPYLYGRVDLNKYKIGAAKMSNFIVDYKGGAAKRPGTRYVGQAKYPLRQVILVPFQFSESQTYVLEFGDGYMRVITNGGYVLNTSNAIYEIVTPWPVTALKQLKWTQSADTMTFTHQLYPTTEIVRHGHADWRVQNFTVGATISPPSFVSIGATASGFIDARSAVYTNMSYAVTTLGDDGSESQLSPVARALGILDMTVHKVVAYISWGQVAGAASYNVWKASTGDGAYMPAGTALGYAGSSLSEYFIDNNILPNFTRSAPQHNNPFAPGTITDVLMTAYGFGFGQGQNAYITVSDPTGFGAVLLPQVRDDACVGAYIQDGGQNYTNPTLNFYGGSSTPTGVAVLGPQTGTYPGAVSYYQQRLMFGGSVNRPSTLWGSRPGSFHNFDTGIPVADDDSLEFTLASQQLNIIKYMLGMPGGLVVLTTGGTWQLSGTQQFAPITPTQVMATPQAFHGCGDLPPITIGYEILFIQSAGSIIRNLSYNFFANIYTSADVTVLSSHLFSGRTMAAWSYAEEPDKIIWLIRDDGKLISFTFLKEQEVAGFAQHSTNGQYQAVATVREGLRDVTYFAVNRTNPWSGTSYTSIERLASRLMPGGVEDAWYLDCALDLPPAVSITNTRLISGPVIKTGMVFSAAAALFNAGWINGILRVAGGKYRVTSVQSSTVLYANEIYPVNMTLYNEEQGSYYMIPQYQWDLSLEVTSVKGLDHLEGQTVSILADGIVQNNKVVTGGVVHLDNPASRIIVGLGYVADLQTLRLESSPTIQGKRKKIPALTIRLADSRGLWAGMHEATVTELKERDPAIVPGVATPLINGDLRIVMDPLWEADGQVWIKAPYPLPANILAVIPEVVMGDGGGGA